MGVRRHVATAIFGALLVLCAPALATAGTSTHRDANDVAGRLDIKWARHGHSGAALVHTIGTWASFSSRALGGANMVAFALDTNWSWADDAEWWAYVYRADGRLRAQLVDSKFTTVTQIQVRRPAANRLQVRIPRAALGDARAYRWFAATVDGSAHDFAPNRGGVLHDLTPPTIKLTSFPALSTDVAAGNTFPVTFAVSDTGGAGIATWRLERRRTGTTSWSRLRSGTTGGAKTAAVTGAEGATYELRVVALDRQGNRRISARRTVTVPFDDAAFADASNGWVAHASLPSYFHGTAQTAFDPGVQLTATFEGTYVAWIAPSGPRWGSGEVVIDAGEPNEVTVPNVVLRAEAETLRAVVFERAALPPGQHTITIRPLSGEIAVDAIAPR